MTDGNKGPDIKSSRKDMELSRVMPPAERLSAIEYIIDQHMGQGRLIKPVVAEVCAQYHLGERAVYNLVKKAWKEVTNHFVYTSPKAMNRARGKMLLKFERLADQALRVGIPTRYGNAPDYKAAVMAYTEMTKLMGLMTDGGEIKGRGDTNITFNVQAPTVPYFCSQDAEDAEITPLPALPRTVSSEPVPEEVLVAPAEPEVLVAPAEPESIE